MASGIHGVVRSDTEQTENRQKHHRRLPENQGGFSVPGRKRPVRQANQQKKGSHQPKEHQIVNIRLGAEQIDKIDRQREKGKRQKSRDAGDGRLTEKPEDWRQTQQPDSDQREPVAGQKPIGKEEGVPIRPGREKEQAAETVSFTNTQTAS